MEEINIISSIIDEYKQQLKDNDYKICMETLMKIYKKKINIDEYNRENFIKINNNQFIHIEGYKYIFDENKIYDNLFEKYFIITGNDDDIISSNIISSKLQIHIIKLKNYMYCYNGIKEIINKKKHSYLGIKLRQ